MYEHSYYEIDQDNQTDNLISRLGSTSHFPLHFHRKIELTYMICGSNVSYISNAKYCAEKDDILFIPQYQTHSYTTTADAQRFVFMPTPDFMSDSIRIFESRSLPPLLASKRFNREKILPLFEDMHATLADKSLAPHTKELLLKGYTDIVFGRLLEEYGALLTENNGSVELIFHILTFIEENYAENITLELLADRFGYNKFYFSRLFNVHIGESLNIYVNTVRVNKMLAQLKNQSSVNITNAAMNAGFNSMPSFYRAFKRIYHCSPKEFFKRKSETFSP